MNTLTTRMGIRALLTAILLTGLLATAALAGDDAQTICEGNGGSWVSSPDASNGVCVYSPDDPPYDCVEPFLHEEVWTADSFDFEQCVDFRPFDVNQVDTCAWIGGTWDQSGDPWTCTVTHTAFGDCPGTTIYLYQTSTSDYIGFECAGDGTGDGGGNGGGGQPTTVLRNPGYSKHGGKIKDDSAGSTHLGGSKNGSFYYSEGTCTEGCIFTPNLPAGAAATLPADAVATLYIRLADGGTGSYTVCFDATGISSPVIYQVISGVWVAIPTFSSGGQICATASGDGAFALGGS
ncbi:MAG: hypothetical protein EPO32_04540 [Anaerolineae bacterium]|nr:MAG: hypothetical protein EPO32_04540 [Anaerolineae bacterium]